MDYETFISENIQEVTKRLNDVIQSFKSKELGISLEYIDTLSNKLDSLENTNQREFFIQSFIFENLVSDLDKINRLIIKDENNNLSDDYLIRECFNSSILEGVLSANHKKSKSHREYLLFVDANHEYLENQIKKHTNTLIKNKKIITTVSLNNFKNWCFEAFNTPKFYTRNYIYLYFYKNQSSINLSIDSNNQKENILDELLEAV